MCIGILLFQQCAGNTQFSPAQTSTAAGNQTEQQATEGGNGDGYEGKIYVSQGTCPNAPKHISSEITFDREKLQAKLRRDKCEDLNPALAIDVADFEELEPNLESFRYRGEIFLPKERVGAATVEGILPGTVEEVPPGAVVTEEFSMNSPSACGTGFCSCTSSGLYSCGASEKMPDAFCKSKGYTEAVSWTCAQGPQGRVCTTIAGSSNSCWQNQNPGNSICDRVTCK